MTSPHMYTVLMRRLSLLIDPYTTNSNEIESSLSTVLLYICPHGRCPITSALHGGLLVSCASYTQHVLLLIYSYSYILNTYSLTHIYKTCTEQHCMCPQTASLASCNTALHRSIQGQTSIAMYSHNTIILCDVAARPAVEGGPWPNVK